MEAPPGAIAAPGTSALARARGGSATVITDLPSSRACHIKAAV